jgi:TPP-dependent indolepyruvate ferredoxin oxidoreductase alpha subunit
MAFPTSVNSQITDAISQSGVQVLAGAPAMAMGSLYQTVAQAAGIASQNAVAHQQAAQQVSSAIVARAIDSILGTAGK